MVPQVHIRTHGLPEFVLCRPSPMTKSGAEGRHRKALLEVIKQRSKAVTGPRYNGGGSLGVVNVERFRSGWCREEGREPLAAVLRQPAALPQ